MAITSVRQRYESTESQHGYKTGTETTFGERGAPIDIGKSKDNFNKNGKLRYFNYNICEHMAKKYWKLRKDKETRKCYKCEKVGHLAKNCRSEQKMKTRSIKEESDKEDNNNKESFAEGSE